MNLYLHTDCDSADDLVLEVIFILGNGGNIPIAGGNLLVGRDEVPDQNEDSHDDMLGDRDDIGSGDLGDGDVLLVGSVKIDVIGANPSSDCNLEVLGLGQPLPCQVAWVERGSDDDFGINKLLIEL